MNKEEIINDILTRSTAEIIGKEKLLSQLQEGKPLKIKLGIDPTSTNLHVGRAVVLWKLRAFQELGHKIVLIIGDFTAQIGDTSDKDAERPMLSEEQVKSNMLEYKRQLFKILDENKTTIYYNSEWLSKLSFIELCKIADLFSLNEFASRENIAKRFEAGKRISLRELLYPIMQGYDSIATKADVELGGTDQRFNLLAGRTIQDHYKEPVQSILMTGIIEGLDGRKMSSSYGNTINLLDEADDMFGKVMSLRDELIESYFIHCTRLPIEEINTFLTSTPHPKDKKQRLAFEITKLYHTEELAKKASENFTNTFTNKQLPDNIESRKIDAGNYNLANLIFEAGLASSKAEAKRIIEQNGVKINQQAPTSENIVITDKNDIILQVGKRKFIRIL